MRKIFRDYSVLIVAHKLQLTSYAEMVKPMGFGNVITTDDDKKVIEQIKAVKPQLVLAGRNLSVFTGPQILAAVRREEILDNTPFIIMGDKQDLKPGGLGENVNKEKLAKMVGGPVSEAAFSQAVLDLLDPLIDPQKEEAYCLFEEAEGLSKAGSLNEAVEKYRRGLDICANSDICIKLASLLMDLGEEAEAEEEFFKALEMDSNSLKAYFGLADLYEGTGEYQSAIDILQQALMIARRIKSSDKSVSRINFYIGEFELRLKRLQAARQSFEEAIEVNPDDAELRNDIGDAYSEKGYYAEAEEHYRAALDLDPGLAHAFNRLGIAYRKQHKYDRAIDLYHSAQKHTENDEHLIFNLARAHFESNHFVEARELLEKALAISPGFKEARLLLDKISSMRKRVELSDDPPLDLDTDPKATGGLKADGESSPGPPDNKG